MVVIEAGPPHDPNHCKAPGIMQGAAGVTGGGVAGLTAHVGKSVDQNPPDPHAKPEKPV